MPPPCCAIPAVWRSPVWAASRRSRTTTHCRRRWTAAAPTGRYLVRESEQGITVRITLVIYNEAKAHSPGYPSETFELAVRAVASLGTYHIKHGYSVRLISNDAAASRELRGAQAR